VQFAPIFYFFKNSFAMANPTAPWKFLHQFFSVLKALS